jgi:hypothetical protein
MRYYWIALASLILLSTPVSATEFCRNRSVFVKLDPHHVEEVKGRFLIINSLPFAIKDLPPESGLAVLQISYRRLTPGDRFSEPSSMELGARVFGVLEDSLKKLGIQKIWADYAPDQDQGC